MVITKKYICKVMKLRMKVFEALRFVQQVENELAMNNSIRNQNRMIRALKRSKRLLKKLLKKYNRLGL